MHFGLPMFSLATDADFPLLRELIRDGALGGSFDPVLAQDGPESALFFESLRHVIADNVWQRPGQHGGHVDVTAHILMFHPRYANEAGGFVAVRGIGKLGYELWLTALSPSLRRRGLGQQMLEEFLATPLGLQTMIAQCDHDANGAGACAASLQRLGFKVVRVGRYSTWLANPALATEVIEWIQTVPFSSR